MLSLTGTERRYGAGGEDGNFVAACNRWSAAMPQPNDLSRSLVALDQNSTIIAVIEMSQSSWLVAGTRLALSDVSEGERAGTLVSRPHRRQP